MDENRKTIEGSFAVIKSEHGKKKFRFIASDESIDRHGDVVMQNGWELSHFKKNPVILLGHDVGGFFSEPLLPIGKGSRIKVENKKLMIDIEFASDIDDRSEKVERFVEAGFLKTVSVGFKPIKIEFPRRDAEREGKSGDELKFEIFEINDKNAERETEPDVEVIEYTKDGVTKKRGKKPLPHRRFVKQELFELSIVPIPANTNAERVQMQISKGLITNEDVAAFEEWCAEIEQMKTVIGYRTHGDVVKTDEGKSWNGAGARRRLSTWAGDDFKKFAKGFAFREPDAITEKKKTGFKLPHHDVEGGTFKHHLRGARAAMGALLGARGGVKIPSDERRGVYNHLAREHRRFDKEPPEFRDYQEDELKELFNDVWDDIATLVKDDQEMEDQKATDNVFDRLAKQLKEEEKANSEKVEIKGPSEPIVSTVEDTEEEEVVEEREMSEKDLDGIADAVVEKLQPFIEVIGKMDTQISLMSGTVARLYDALNETNEEIKRLKADALIVGDGEQPKSPDGDLYSVLLDVTRDARDALTNNKGGN